MLIKEKRLIFSVGIGRKFFLVTKNDTSHAQKTAIHCFSPGRFARNWCIDREVGDELEEEVRKTTVARVRRTKCRRDPGPDHRNSGTSDLYFTCGPGSQTQSSAITT